MYGKLYSLILLICLTAITGAAADRTVTVHAIQMPPLIISETDGIVVDRVRKIFACSGLDAHVSIKPWARSYHDAKTDSGALIPTMYTEERAIFFWYPEVPVFTVEYHFFQNVNSDFRWNGDYENLKEFTIAKLRGGAVGDEFDKQEKSGGIKTIEATNFELLLKLIAHERVDLIAVDKATFEYIATRLSLKDRIRQVDGPPLSSRDIFVAFNPNELDEAEKRKVNLCHRELMSKITEGM